MPKSPSIADPQDGNNNNNNQRLTQTSSSQICKDLPNFIITRFQIQYQNSSSNSTDENKEMYVDLFSGKEKFYGNTEMIRFAKQRVDQVQ
jgi:hypothetical protein